MNVTELSARLAAGEYDGRMYALYGPESAARGRERALGLLEAFRLRFDGNGTAEPGLYSAPGRTELGGNHTDHQHGRVLCAAVDRDALCWAVPNGRREIRVRSEGYPEVSIPLDDLEARREERGTTAALVRGTAAYLARRGGAGRGFDACVTSDVPAGSGLSSSAAFEVLMAAVMNELWHGGGWDAMTLARAGQYAENAYFGKPCGLMDQAASALGGAVMIDFADPERPEVTRLEAKLGGNVLCMVDTGSCHADLTEDYAAIPREMGAVAAHFGSAVLARVPEAAFWAAVPALRREAGDRAVLRAMHFFDEQARVPLQARALERGDMKEYLELVNRSGRSSERLLQNVSSPAAPDAQPVALALALGGRLLAGRGAIRVHGGGFAGTVQAYVPGELLPAFRRGMEEVFGPGALRTLRVRQAGAGRVL